MPEITVAQFNDIIEDELPWAHELGVKATEIGAGTATLMIPYDAKMLRPGGTMSGPTMMMLADACMYAVVLSEIGIVKLAVTTNLNINFLRKPEPRNLVAKGSMLKLGKRLAVMAVDVYSEGSDDLVAHTTGTYSIPPKG
ncbi:MAG: PaaI family thioesterase [Rhodospirillales bacterium]|nr:PaaI family thioesterase [Rhodospirillales bacterium]MBO6786971.1 PaaI family thioesterase [Rhodospirillales bacterium]